MKNSIFISPLSDGTERSLSRFAGDAKLQGGLADMPDDCPAILRNLEGLEKWDSRNPVKFITGEQKALYLGRNHLMHTVGHLTGNQVYEKRLDGPGGGRQASNAFSQQRRPTAAGLYEEQCCQQFKGGDLFLLLSPIGAHVEC